MGNLFIHLSKRSVVRADRAMRGADIEPEKVGTFFRNAMQMLEGVIEEARKRHLGILLVRPPFSECITTVYEKGDVQIWVGIPKSPGRMDEVMRIFARGTGDMGPLVEPLLCEPRNGGKKEKSPALEKSAAPPNGKRFEPDAEGIVSRMAQSGSPLPDIALRVLRATGNILKREDMVTAMRKSQVFEVWTSNRAAWLNTNKSGYDETEVAIAFAAGLEGRIPESQIWEILRTYDIVRGKAPQKIVDSPELPKPGQLCRSERQACPLKARSSLGNSSSEKPRHRGRCPRDLTEGQADLGRGVSQQPEPGLVDAMREFIALEMQKGASVVRITAAVAQRFGRVLKREELIAIMRQTGTFDVWTENRAVALNESKTPTCAPVGTAQTAQVMAAPTAAIRDAKDYESKGAIEEDSELQVAMPRGKDKKTPLIECIDAIIVHMKANPGCTVADIAELARKMGAQISETSIPSMFSRWRAQGSDIPYLNTGSVVRLAAARRYEKYGTTIMAYIEKHPDCTIEDIVALPEFDGKTIGGIKRMLSELRKKGVNVPIIRSRLNEKDGRIKSTKKTLANQKDAVISFIRETIARDGKCTRNEVLEYLEKTHGLKIPRDSLKVRLSQWRRAGCEIPFLSADIITERNYNAAP